MLNKTYKLKLIPRLISLIASPFSCLFSFFMQVTLNTEQYSEKHQLLLTASTYYSPLDQSN